MSNQKGFTLIELVVVIIILGILAATALPKFIDMSGDARLAAAKGVAGALSSSSAINYSASLAKGQVFGAAIGSATGTAAVDTDAGCADSVGNALITPAGQFGAGAGKYTISGSTTTATVGQELTCTVTSNDDAAAHENFVLMVTK